MKNQLSKTFPAGQTLPAAILLTALALLAYANTFDAPFVFDDMINIVNNPFIRVAELTPESLAGVFKSREKFRPLANFSLAANYYFHRQDVRSFHAVNLAIHILTALLVFLITRQTLRLCAAENILTPFFAAALWLVNPVHTQSVTYIVQRMNSLAALFFLLALTCYIQARLLRNIGAGRKKIILWFAGCGLSGLFSLVSKETAAVLPAVIFLYEWFFFQNLDRTWLKKRLPWIGAAMAMLAATALIYMDGNPAEKLTKIYDKQTFTPAQRLLTEAGVVIYYVSLLLFPHPARLNLIYDFPLSRSLTNPAVTAPAMAALMLMLIAAVYSAKKHRLLSFAIFWFLITLVIESSIIGLALVFEHRTYLPSIFPVIALTGPALRQVRPKAPVVFILCVAIGVCGLWTYRRNHVWGTALTLWGDNAAKSPRKAAPHVNLGAAFQEAGNDEAATKWCEKALCLDSDHAGANRLRGLLLLKKKQPEKALVFFEKALRLEPEDLQNYHNLGVALAGSGQMEKAAGIFRRIINSFPYAPESFYHLAKIHAHWNDLDTAVDLYQKAVALRPDYARAFNDLGLVLMMQKKIPGAMAALKEAAAIDPGLMSPRLNLALILQQAEPRRALAYAVRAGALAPDDPRPHILAGDLLAKLDDDSRAVMYYEKAAALQPDNPKLLYNLACLHARQNHEKQAVESLMRAVKNGYNNWRHLKADPDLENIRDTEYYRSLIKENP